MKKCIFLFVLIISFVPAVGFTATYYVDPTAAAGGNGSYATPWNSVAQTNGHTFSNGDSLYFRVNTTLVATDAIRIRWTGTSTSRTTIGAYYGNGQFGLRAGDRRPIIRGSYRLAPDGPHVPNSDNAGLIHAQYENGGYVTIQDLEIIESYAAGIVIGSTDKGTSVHNVIRNCVVRDIGRNGISARATKYSLFENNVVDMVCLRKIINAAGKLQHAGANLVVWGGQKEGRSEYNVIRNNYVARGFEGIGVYKASSYATVEDNIVTDIIELQIYVSNSRFATVRNNLVYQPSELWYDDGRKRFCTLIQLDSEGHIERAGYFAGGHDVYNNYLAGGGRSRFGIMLASRSNRHGVGQENVRIYNNRIVGCEYNIAFAKSSQYCKIVDGVEVCEGDTMKDVEDTWSDNHIFNNYSFVYETEGIGDRVMRHVQKTTWPGVSWDNNYYNSVVTGDASNNAKIGVVDLKRKQWVPIKAGMLAVSDFELIDEIKPANPQKVSNVLIIPEG